MEARTVASLTRIVQQLLACSNAGAILSGFALYSTDFYRRFKTETGLSDRSFCEAFDRISPRPAGEWSAVDAVRNVRRLPDGRVSADVVYAPPPSGGPRPPAERYAFVRAEGVDSWLIDDIVRLTDQPSPADAAAAGSPLVFAPCSSDGSTGIEETEQRSLPMLANSLALIAGKLTTMGLGFLAWMAAARLFAQSDVGLASGAVSAMMLCVQLALFGAGAAVISLFPHHQRQPRDLLDTAITLVGTSSLVAAGLFLLLASGLFRELHVVASDPAYALAFVVMCVFGTLGVLFDQLSTTQRRGDQALVRGVVSGVVTLGALVGLDLALDARRALAILLAWAIGNGAPVAVGYLQLRRSFPRYRYRPRLRRDLAYQLSRVGLPNWVLTLTERAPGAILPIVVTEILSPSANAAWYSAWMMAWVVYVVPIQVGLNLFAEAAHRPDHLWRTVRHGIATSLVVGVAAATASAVLGPFLLQFLGQGYAREGTTPLRILVVAVVPFTFIQAYFSACRARQVLGEAILTGALSGLFGVGAAALAGPEHGLTGMAVAWLAVQSVTGVWAVGRLRTLASRSSGHTKPAPDRWTVAIDAGRTAAAEVTAPSCVVARGGASLAVGHGTGFLRGNRRLR